MQKKIIYTAPGRHENPGELQKQLINKIRIAKKYSKKIINQRNTFSKFIGNNLHYTYRSNLNGFQKG